MIGSFLFDSVQRYDPTYEATRLHFEDLAERYGNPIIVLNLIKVCSNTWPLCGTKIIFQVFFGVAVIEKVSYQTHL